GVVGRHDQNAVGAHCLRFPCQVGADARVEANGSDDGQAFADRLDRGRGDVGAFVWAEAEDLTRPARRDDGTDLRVRQPAGVGLDRLEINVAVVRIGRDRKSNGPAQAPLERLQRRVWSSSVHGQTLLQTCIPRLVAYALVRVMGAAPPWGQSLLRSCLASHSFPPPPPATCYPRS